MNGKGTVITILFSLSLIMYCHCIRDHKRTVRIALAQVFCLDGDREGNFARIEHGIAEAKEKGARIVCFPETAILGWVNPDAHHGACPIPGRDSERLCELAQTYGVFLCAGLAEKEDEHLYDSVILIDDRGTLLLKHRKINILKHLMDPPYTPGKDIQAIQTPFGRIGLLICADSFREELLERMKEQKPDLVLIPYGWAADEDEWPEHGKELMKTVKNAAQKIGCPVIGTDLVGAITHGPWTGKTYGGQSVAADPSGKILGIGKDRDRDILIIDLIL